VRGQFQYVGPPVQHFVSDVSERRHRSQIALLRPRVDGGAPDLFDLRRWMRPGEFVSVLLQPHAIRG
jgi:hypothetical protein